MIIQTEVLQKTHKEGHVKDKVADTGDEQPWQHVPGRKKYEETCCIHVSGRNDGTW